MNNAEKIEKESKKSDRQEKIVKNIEDENIQKMSQEPHKSINQENQGNISKGFERFARKTKI